MPSFSRFKVGDVMLFPYDGTVTVWVDERTMLILCNEDPTDKRFRPGTTYTFGGDTFRHQAGVKLL